MRALVAASCAFGLLFVVAALRFAFATPVSTIEMPLLDPHPEGVHNLAFYRYGPTILASSFMFEAGHHPSYVVDGVREPAGVAKWVSAAGDHTPFLEVRLRETHAIERVVVALAGTREAPVLDLKRAHARCLDAEGRPYGTPLAADAVRSHFTFALVCRARGVRLDFELVHDGIEDVTRIYEVEVMGR